MYCAMTQASSLDKRMLDSVKGASEAANNQIESGREKRDGDAKGPGGFKEIVLAINSNVMN